LISDSVNEYLQLSESINPADRDKVARVKAAFERRNQKSTAAVIHYKKKLDSYELKLKQLNESSFVNKSYSLPSTGVNPSPFFRGLRYICLIFYPVLLQQKKLLIAKVACGLVQKQCISLI
jgi:Predicted transmembrane and coiled-coil 2 protein